MVKFFKFVHKKIIKSRKGQTAVEYALIIGGVALALYVVLTQLQGKLDTGVKSVGEKIQQELEKGGNLQ